MDALGDLEERLVPSDHQPAGVDVGSVQIAEQEPEHLGDAAPLLGGVEVPKAPACELIGGVLQAVHEPSTLTGVKDGFEPPRVELRYRNILHQRAGRLPRQRALSYGGCSCRRGPLPEAASGKPRPAFVGSLHCSW